MQVWPRSFFFYGTLMDGDVQRLVLGRELTGGCAATLPGHAVRRVLGASYPVICRQKDACAEGMTFPNLSQEDARALDRYEGSEYRRETLMVKLADGTMRTAELYMQRSPMPTEDRPW